MKENYLSRNNYRQYRSRRLRRLLVIFICAVLVYVLYEISAVSMVKIIFNGARIIFHNKSTLVLENKELEAKVISLETKVTFLEQAMVSEHEGKNVATARVSSRPPENPYDILTVSIETGNVPKVGSSAFLPNGLLVGKVSESSSEGADVKLFSTVDEKMPATLERNEVRVEIIGMGSGNFKIKVPRDVAVRKEDKILFSDSKGLMAIVEDVSTKPSDSFKEVLAKSPANIFTIELLLIEQ